jgi:hypothetical protein
MNLDKYLNNLSPYPIISSNMITYGLCTIPPVDFFLWGFLALFIVYGVVMSHKEWLEFLVPHKDFSKSHNDHAGTYFRE